MLYIQTYIYIYIYMYIQYAQYIHVYIVYIHMYTIYIYLFIYLYYIYMIMLYVYYIQNYIYMIHIIFISYVHIGLQAQRQANRAAAEVEGQRAAGQLASRAKGVMSWTGVVVDLWWIYGGYHWIHTYGWKIIVNRYLFSMVIHHSLYCCGFIWWWIMMGIWWGYHCG